MEDIDIAGCPEPFRASTVAARLLRERLERARVERGADEALAYETLIGQRVAFLLEGGMHSIDVATMRAIVDYVEIPEEEDTATGLGRAVRGFREKLAQRGGPVE